MRIFLGAILALVLIAGPGVAQERAWIGKARMFTNDKLGDGKDRWRTGSFSVSGIRGRAWEGDVPTGLGQLMEYRLMTEIIAPDDLTNPVLGTDRPFVGAIHLGAFSHFGLGAGEATLGIDLVVTGEQTGLGSFQSWVHQAIGMGATQVLGSQIGNAVHPTLVAAYGQDFDVGGDAPGRMAFRPFIEAQAGVETFVRIGGDLTFGALGSGDFLVRNNVTGFRNVAIKGTRSRSHSFIIGGDVAYVTNSKYLPVASGYTLVKPRARFRMGVYAEGRSASIFYGLTWLGREFANQPGGQIVGSMTYRMNF